MREIYNIFQKPLRTQKTQKIKETKILADYRERNSLLISELIHLGLKIEFKNLKVADYLVNDIAIERKTVSDFISSMINRRLLKQLEELKQYKHNLLIIEGIDEQELYSNEDVIYSKYAISQEAIRNRPSELRGKSKKTRGLSSNSIRGFLLSILLKHKVPIIFTKNSEDTAKFILIISKRKPKELSLNVSKKSLDRKERLQFILEGFPGIGPKSAKKLLEKFKTIKNIANASEQELKEVIGKKAGIIKKIIEGEY